MIELFSYLFCFLCKWNLDLEHKENCPIFSVLIETNVFFVYEFLYFFRSFFYLFSSFLFDHCLSRLLCFVHIIQFIADIIFFSYYFSFGIKCVRCAANRLVALHQSICATKGGHLAETLTQIQPCLPKRPYFHYVWHHGDITCTSGDTV